MKTTTYNTELKASAIYVPDCNMTIISKPADPDAVSLLKLPGEIRNAIYEAILVHDQRVRVVDGHAHFPVVSILATCQQISLEATPILDSRNTFVVSVSKPPERAWNLRDDELVFIAEKWLRQLGRQIIHLELVLIEMSEDNWVPCIDVYPLLPYIWDSVNTRLRIEFAPPTYALPMLRPAQNFQICDMNKTLAAPGSAKAKHIRAYGRFPYLVSSIFIYTDWSGWCIKLNMSQISDPNASGNACFDITAEGHCTLEQQLLKSAIVKFMGNRRLMIYFLRSRIVSSNDIPKYDLDKLVAYPLVPPLAKTSALELFIHGYCPRE
ncbi:hypothetical protein BKA63DRAFT_571680 [Paraphoma chrysanthemicola]|nr:hypothetical protein BKA63DRAFT_571680 [Paraphoma chrysanthemicola]